MEMIKRSGQQGVPVTTTDEEVIVGFDQQRLGRIAEKYAKPKRPPLGLLAADAEQYLSMHPGAGERLPAGTKGVFVGSLRSGSVAEKSGLQNGDVIVAAAGKKIRTMAMLDQMIDTLGAGQKISVRYLRNGEEGSTTFQF